MRRHSQYLEQVMTVDVVENGRSQVGYEYVRDRVAQQTIHKTPVTKTLVTKTLFTKTQI